MTENATCQLPTARPATMATSTCVVCGTETPQQREGVMYECEHCMNDHNE